MTEMLKLNAKSDEPIVCEGHANYFNGNLWLVFLNKTIAEVFEILSTEGAIESIEHDSYYFTQSYTGFNFVKNVNQQEDRIEVRLLGGKQGEVVKKEIGYEGNVAGNGFDVVPNDNGGES